MHAGDEKDLGRSMTQLKQTTQQEKGKNAKLSMEKKKEHTNPTVRVSLFGPTYSKHASKRSPNSGRARDIIP